jgi:hypothetical protein
MGYSLSAIDIVAVADVIQSYDVIPCPIPISRHFRILSDLTAVSSYRKWLGLSGYSREPTLTLTACFRAQYRVQRTYRKVWTGLVKASRRSSEKEKQTFVRVQVWEYPSRKPCVEVCVHGPCSPNYGTLHFSSFFLLFLSTLLT